MCGIIGYIGKRNALPILIDGLKRLEYRGYDSAGVAVLNHGKAVLARKKGKIRELEHSLHGKDLTGIAGLGHTRWATHGKPSDENAHPHRASCFGRQGVIVVHNGIVENHLALRAALSKKGHRFASETDTEVIAHLIEDKLSGGAALEDAVRVALREVEGSYAIGILAEGEPDKIIAARSQSPLVLGFGDGENYFASDVPALLEETRRMTFLEDGEMAVLSEGSISITGMDGRARTRPPREISWSPLMAEKGGFTHFMQKEISEQPRAVADTLRGRFSMEKSTIVLNGIKPEHLQDVRKCFLIACGTSWHAALVGKFLIEDLAGLPCEVDLASEFRYRKTPIGRGDLLVPISQSGETADTLAALKEGKSRGAAVLAICNVVESSIARESHHVLYTHAGPEIGVASTKAFTSQLTALYLLALFLAQTMKALGKKEIAVHLEDLLRLPSRMEAVLKAEGEVIALARKYFQYTDFLYLGRGINYPIALEGALKLKEISYIHAEGYPAGEMKHGPIALIDEHMPVVVLAPAGRTYEKVRGNIEEVRARGGKVIAIATQGDADISRHCDDLLSIPASHEFAAPFLLTIPLQLFAYHVAVLRGTDVDQPRNLAKSVTVE